MTIAYLIDYNLNDDSGVIQKIKQQSSQWTKKGHTVYFVSTKTMSIYDADYNVIAKKKPLDLNFGRFGTAIKLLYHSYALYGLLQEIEFDLIYMRYRMYMPFFSKITKRYKVVMEINSDDKLEYPLHSKVTNIYNRLTRNLLLKNIDAFVSVSNELKERFNYLGKPIEVIANGINTKEYEVKSNVNKVPTLVFIGTPNQPWHGLDKILEMAKHFKEYQFYIIGTKGKDTENIKYFGYLTKEDATKIINRSDIGIGTLSLYKKGLTEASPLKTRQYLACGLPLIYAYKDTDFDSDVEFGLQLDNSENNIEYERIEAFVKKVFNNKNIRKLARTFAVTQLDYEIKEEKRLKFFKRVLDES